MWGLSLTNFKLVRPLFTNGSNVAMKQVTFVQENLGALAMVIKLQIGGLSNSLHRPMDIRHSQRWLRLGMERWVAKQWAVVCKRSISHEKKDLRIQRARWRQTRSLYSDFSLKGLWVSVFCGWVRHWWHGRLSLWLQPKGTTIPCPETRFKNNTCEYDCSA